MESGILLALIGIGEAILTSIVTFLLTRRKYKTEVQGGQIENTGHEIDNKHNDLDFYIKLANDNKEKLKELSQENRDLRKEMAEMRTVVFGMLQQVCTDILCQERKFDQEQCPYYETIFKLHDENRELGEE